MVLNFEPAPELVGVLDWELATVGDPLMDLGSALAYWVDRNDDATFAALRRQPSDLPGCQHEKNLSKNIYDCQVCPVQISLSMKSLDSFDLQ
ncbi:MAG: phosphotransferase [Actinomycetota bacterium]